MLMTALLDEGYPSDNLKERCKKLCDQLTWYLILGTIIGARLGHVIFYEWPRYQSNPIDIFKVWEGGLACHGAIAGILIAIFLFHKKVRKQYPPFSFMKLVDILAAPCVLGGFFIRIGNFINQEILGTPTSVPWGVVFGDPIDGSYPIARHPVQLYEALANLSIFILLLSLWRIRWVRSLPGFTAGICLILVFGVRSVLEFFKEPQSLMINESWFTTGQILSVPLILTGIFFCLVSFYKLKQTTSKPPIN